MVTNRPVTEVSAENGEIDRDDRSFPLLNPLSLKAAQCGKAGHWWTNEKPIRLAGQRRQP